METKERLGKMYAEHHARGERYDFVFGGEERAKILSDWIGSSKRVLDLGCRDGSLTRFYSDRNEVVGVDIDQEALQRCQKALPIKTYWSNLWDGLPFKNDEFDVVVAGEILEHLPSPTFVVGEVGRVLKPGGLFVGSVPNSFRFKNRLLFLFGKDFELDPTHFHHYSPTTLKEILQMFFCDIEIRYRASRFLWVWPRMFGNCMLWRCRKTVEPSISGD